MPELDDEIAVTRWAFALSAPERGRLLLTLANVLAAEDLRERPRARALLDSLLPALAQEAAAHVREEMARRLADAVWAPPALLTDLAFDAELRTQPALALAAAADDDLLLRLAVEGNPETRRVLARRPGLPPAALDALIDAARGRPLLRAPLTRRTDLSPDQASRLSAFAGPDAVRQLRGRYNLDAAAPAEADLETETHLLDKLQNAGRLTPTWAVAALRGGRLRLFQQAVARLGGVEPTAVAQALTTEAAGALALACAASGIDRAVFPTVLSAVTGLTGRPAFARPAGAEVLAAFRRPPNEAARELRTRARFREARKAGPAA